MDYSKETAGQLNLIIRRVPKHSTTKLVFENLNITDLMQPVTAQMTLLRALKQFTSLQLLDLSSNNIDMLVPGQTDVQLSSVISVNLSDNPINSVQPCIDQLQSLMPNVTDLQISLQKEEDVDFIITRMPQLEYLNNLPIDRGEGSTVCSKLQLDMGETPSLDRITSIACSVPDEFNEETKVPQNMAKQIQGDTTSILSIEDQQKGIPEQNKGDNSIASMNETFKSSMHNQTSKSILHSNRSRKISNKVRATMTRPEQPIAEMSSINLIDASDESMTRNELLVGNTTNPGDESIEKVSSSELGKMKTYASPSKKSVVEKNFYISPSALSRSDMVDPTREAQESYRGSQQQATAPISVSAKSLPQNKINEQSYAQRTSSRQSKVDEKQKDMIQLGNSMNNLSSVRFGQVENLVSGQKSHHTRHSSLENKVFEGQSVIAKAPAFIQRESSVDYGSITSAKSNSRFTQMRGRLTSAIQNGSRSTNLSKQNQTLSKSDVEELNGLCAKIRTYKLEKVIGKKGGIGQQQVSESETMLMDSKMAKEFESQLKIVTKSLEKTLNNTSSTLRNNKSKSSMMSQGMSTADRQIEVLKSKYFLLDVLFEKAVENLRFNPTLIKNRAKDLADQQFVAILTQLRTSMCQSFVNLAKQQQTVAQDVDDVRDLYENELQQRNDDIAKMCDEVKSTQQELLRAQQIMETSAQNKTHREEELEQQVFRLQNDLVILQKEQHYKQGELNEQFLVVEEHKTMLAEQEMHIKEYSQRLADTTMTVGGLEIDLKQTENEKALEREEFNARRQALSQQLQQVQGELNAAKDEIKTTNSVLEGSKMWAENLQQQLDETRQDSSKQVTELQQELLASRQVSHREIDQFKTQMQELKQLSYREVDQLNHGIEQKNREVEQYKQQAAEQQNSFNHRMTETQIIHERETEMLQQKVQELRRQLDGKYEEMTERTRQKEQEINDIKAQKTEKINTLRQKNGDEVAELKQKMREEFTQIKEQHNDEVRTLKGKMCDELDGLKDKQKEDILQLKEKAQKEQEIQRQKAEDDKKEMKEKAEQEVKEMREKANQEVVEIKQKTIDDLNQLKVKAAKENEELKTQISQLDSENLVLTESNIQLTNKAEHTKKEYTSYKSDAEQMIEDLHEENSKQTEMIVKHSIMVADRQTKLRHKLTQTEAPEQPQPKNATTLPKNKSAQRLSISSHQYETNPRGAMKSKKTGIDFSIPISNMNLNMGGENQKSTDRLSESASATQIRLNLKQMNNRRPRKQRTNSNQNSGPSPVAASQPKLPFYVNPNRQQPLTSSYSALNRVNQHTLKPVKDVSPLRQSLDGQKSHVSIIKSPINICTPISPQSFATLSNLDNMSVRPKNSRTIGHGLTLRQTKELIHELFLSKNKSDEQCIAKKQARETMEQHMYTFLNQRYGLKQLIVDWAAALIGAIKHFSPVDHEVKLFGKILKNSTDEEFWLVQLHVKATIQSLIRQQVREKNASKQAKTIAEIASDMLSDRVKVEQSMWLKIIDRMYEDKDCVLLKQQILECALSVHNAELERQKDIPSARYGGSRSRDRGEKRRSNVRSGERSKSISHRAGQSDPSTQLVLSDLVKVIQDFQLQEHESFLNNFMRLFRAQDSDRDGILNPEQFKSLLVTMNIGITDKQTEIFLQQLDPFCTESIPLSDVIQLLSNQQTTVKQLQQIQESSSWQEASKNVDLNNNRSDGEQVSPHKLSRVSLMQPSSASTTVLKDLESSDNSLVVVSSAKGEFKFKGMLSSTQEVGPTRLF